MGGGGVVSTDQTSYPYRPNTLVKLDLGQTAVQGAGTHNGRATRRATHMQVCLAGEVSSSRSSVLARQNPREKIASCIGGSHHKPSAYGAGAGRWTKTSGLSGGRPVREEEATTRTDLSRHYLPVLLLFLLLARGRRRFHLHHRHLVPAAVLVAVYHHAPPLLAVRLRLCPAPAPAPSTAAVTSFGLGAGDLHNVVVVRVRTIILDDDRRLARLSCGVPIGGGVREGL